MHGEDGVWEREGVSVIDLARYLHTKRERGVIMSSNTGRDGVVEKKER